MDLSELRQQWSKLARMGERKREAPLRAQLEGIAELTEEERQRQLESMVEFVYTLPDDQIASFVRSTLRAWLSMDPGKAEKVARSYELAGEKTPEFIALRRALIVPPIVRKFSSKEQERLRYLMAVALKGQQ